MKRDTIIIVLALIAGFLGGAVSSTIFTAQDAGAQRSENFISARGLQIIDEYGNTRIRLGVFSSGEPGIYFYDERSRTRARFISKEVVFCDKTGNDRVSLGLETWEEKPALYFKNTNQQTQISMELDPSGNGQPSLCFYDEYKNVRLGLGNNSFEDKKTGRYEELPFSAGVFDRDGKILWKAP